MDIFIKFLYHLVTTVKQLEIFKGNYGYAYEINKYKIL